MKIVEKIFVTRKKTKKFSPAWSQNGRCGFNSYKTI